mmetsp:Transcript_11791/g.39368  ORF Transcript_11791/g.39368 Transcript_11791/m.39368 type:complete len:211 (+) Transcript_11791:4052-4684(+)
MPGRDVHREARRRLWHALRRRRPDTRVRRRAQRVDGAAAHVAQRERVQAADVQAVVAVRGADRQRGAHRDQIVFGGRREQTRPRGGEELDLPLVAAAPAEQVRGGGGGAGERRRDARVRVRRQRNRARVAARRIGDTDAVPRAADVDQIRRLRRIRRGQGSAVNRREARGGDAARRGRQARRASAHHLDSADALQRLQSVAHRLRGRGRL